jgi:integrase
LLAQAGLPPGPRFHDLRHTRATLLLANGTHPKVVQEMLGHSTISITLDTYSHVLPNMQREAVKAMEDLIE